LLTIGEDIDSRALLRGNGKTDRVISRLGKFFVGHATFEVIAKRVQ
jgi:hypothetical protein